MQTCFLDVTLLFEQNIDSAKSYPLKLETRLKEELGIDSLRLVEVMIMLEEHFQILFDESDMDPGALNTLEDIAKLVYSTMKKKD